jgi:hypothetical protein
VCGRATGEGAAGECDGEWDGDGECGRDGECVGEWAGAACT